MKKTAFLLLVILFPLTLSAQKIKQSIIDDFTGKKVIYTSEEWIKNNNVLSLKDGIKCFFRYENDIIFLHLEWSTGDIRSISDDAQLIFKFSNNEVVTVNTVTYAVTDIEDKSAVRKGLKSYIIKPLYTGDFSAFDSDNYVTKLRIYTSEGYRDIDLKEKAAKKLNTMYKLLIEEIGK